MNTYNMMIDGGQGGDKAIIADNLNDAIEDAIQWAKDGDWPQNMGKIEVHVGVVNQDDEDDSWSGDVVVVNEMKYVMYIISDGNARERTDDWDEVIRITESWYEYISEYPEGYWEGNPEEIPDNPEYDVSYGDIDDLNFKIGEFEEKMARLQHIHNSYNLTVSIEEDQ